MTFRTWASAVCLAFAAAAPAVVVHTYLAVLLFVKNPTVIAFTFAWWVGLIRQAAVSRPASVGSASRR